MADHPESIRLNKHLALQLGVSRREADTLIEKGVVRVNDTPVGLGSRIQPNDAITVAGKPLGGRTAYQYLAFNKPTGYVCSRKSQGDTPTIYSLLPKEYATLKTVGRLDKDSSGIIILTNDGDFAHRMTHPKFAKTKRYLIRLDKELEPLHQQMISDFGVQLEDGPSKFLLARKSDTSRREWEITMSEGRNRQIRRTFAALGYAVKKLHRIQFGHFALGTLKPGQFSPAKETGEFL